MKTVIKFVTTIYDEILDNIRQVESSFVRGTVFLILWLLIAFALITLGFLSVTWSIWILPVIILVGLSIDAIIWIGENFAPQYR